MYIEKEKLIFFCLFVCQSLVNSLDFSIASSWVLGWAGYRDYPTDTQTGVLLSKLPRSVFSLSSPLSPTAVTVLSVKTTFLALFC